MLLGSDNCRRDMATKLEKLLVEIDPSRTIDVVEKRINDAFAYYREQNRVGTYGTQSGRPLRAWHLPC